jgi:hypothetical protein
MHLVQAWAEQHGGIRAALNRPEAPSVSCNRQRWFACLHRWLGRVVGAWLGSLVASA